MCLSIGLSICLLVCLSICVSVYWCVCLSIDVSVYLSIGLSVCLFVCSSDYLSVCFFVSINELGLFSALHYLTSILYSFREGGMDISLFKRLSENHPHAVVNLEHQYRMHKDIMLLSNTLIYQHRLKCGTEEVAEHLLHLPNWDSLREVVSEMDKQREGLMSYIH